jgi:hypothetical protein
MADDDTEVLTEESAEVSTGMDFSEDELAALEEGFSEDEPTEDESEETGEEEEEEAGEEEGEDSSGDPEEEGSSTPEEGEESLTEDGEAGEETKDEGYELTVDGQAVLVDTEEELAAWAQKGIHYEKHAQETQKRMEDATFALQSMLNDPAAFLVNFHAGQNGGNREAARQVVFEICRNYVMPILDEQAADPAKRLQLQRARWDQDQQQAAQERRIEQQNSYTQEDIQELHNLERGANAALERVGLPQDSAMRKRMAGFMLGALDRGHQMHPIEAAEIVRREVDEYQKAAGKAAPKGQKKPDKRSRKEKQAAIKRAKAKRSRKKTGNATATGRRREEPRTMNSREFLDGINTALNLDP